MAGYGGGSSVPRVREYPITLRDGTVIKAQMRTVQGNQDYLDVKWRVVWMRAENGHKIGVISEPLEHVFGRYAIFRTTLLDADGRIIAIAHKMETRDGFADYYEKAETGSLGRALAIAGYGTAFCGQEFSVGDDISESGVERETADSVEEAAKAAAAAAASRRRGMRNPAEIPTPATSNPPTSAAPTSAPSRTAAPTSADPVSPAPEPKPEPKPKAETAERKAPAKPEPAPAPEPEPKADEKPAEKAQPKAEEPKAEEPKAEEPKAEQNSAAASDAKEFTGEVIVASRPMTGTNAKNKPYCMVTAQYGQRKLRVVAMGTGDPKAPGLMPKLQALKVGDRLNGKFQLIKGDIYAWVS